MSKHAREKLRSLCGERRELGVRVCVGEKEKCRQGIQIMLPEETPRNNEE